MTEANSSSEQNNRMARRRLKTRQKLLDATEQLIIKKGIDKTTLDDITETADLGRRTFYYHFSSKEACIQAAAADIYQRHAREIPEHLQSDDPANLVATSVQLVLGALMDEPITGALLNHPRLLGNTIISALGEFAHRDIKRGTDEQRFEPAVAPEVLDKMIMWTIAGVVIETYQQPEARKQLLRDYAQTFLMILGIPVKEARKIADKTRDALPV